LWLILISSSIGAWTFPPLGGFRHTGWLWIIIGITIAILLLSSYKGIQFGWVYLCFLGYAFLSLAWLDKDFGRENIQDILQLAVPFFALVLAQSLPVYKNRKREIELFTIWPVFFTAVLVFLPLIVHIVLGVNFMSKRPSSITMTFFGACFLGHAAAGYKRGWLGAAFSFLFCFLIGSRMATFAHLVMAALVPIKKHFFMKRVLVLLFLVIIANVIFNTTLMQTRFFYGGTGTYEDIIEFRFSTSGRSYIWPLIWEKAWERPVFGHGAGSSHFETILITGLIEHPHNDYLKVFYEYGIFGFVIFWFFFLRMWLCALNSTFKEKNIYSFTISSQAFLSLTGFFLLALTENLILYTTQFMVPFFFLIGAFEKSRYS